MSHEAGEEGNETQQSTAANHQKRALDPRTRPVSCLPALRGGSRQARGSRRLDDRRTAPSCGRHSHIAATAGAMGRERSSSRRISGMASMGGGRRRLRWREASLIGFMLCARRTVCRSRVKPRWCGSSGRTTRETRWRRSPHGRGLLEGLEDDSRARIPDGQEHRCRGLDRGL